jgi:hypothetical protein
MLGLYFRYGLQAICEGGGTANATIIKLMPSSGAVGDTWLLVFRALWIFADVHQELVLTPTSSGSDQAYIPAAAHGSTANPVVRLPCYFLTTLNCRGGFSTVESLHR